jgi:phosphoglycerate dehydrogenase-like enzyme
MEGVAEVVPPTGLHDALASADVVLVALALTEETDGMLGADEFRVMKGHAWLVNIARGRVVDQDALIVALQERWIGGAALDAMTPEPLPSDHVLWTLDNCLITPHVAVGYELGLPLLGERFRQNVGHFANGTEMVGLVDLLRGY